MATRRENEESKSELLKEIELAYARIAEQNKASATAAEKEAAALKLKIEREKEIVRELEKQVEVLDKSISRSEKLANIRAKHKENENDIVEKNEEFQTSFSKFSPFVKKTLGDINSQNNTLRASQVAISNLMKDQINLTGQELQISKDKINVIQDLQTSLIEQAKSVETQRDELFGVTEETKRREAFQQSIVGMSKEEAELAKQLFLAKENLIKQESRYRDLTEATSNILDEMPEGLKSSLQFAKSLLTTMGPIAILGAVLVSAFKIFKDLNDSAKEFRTTTGLTNSQMEGIKSKSQDITVDFADLGVEAKNVFDIVASLKTEFSDIANFSTETLSALTVLNANFGISAENLGKVQQQFEAIGGLSSETAANVALQAANMANLAGVAPAQVFKDIAESADVTAKYFRGDINSLVRQTVEARRLGTTIKDIAETAKGLLDFEKNIEDELTASAMVGADVNFQRARELAYTGDLVGMQNEVLNQIQKIGDFRKLDVFQQEALADASGMTTAEILKQLDNKEKIASLSISERKAAEDAINAGLDISNISKDQLTSEVQKYKAQQETQAQLDKLQNSFNAIAVTLGSVLVPLFETLGPILEYALLPISLMAQGLKEMGVFGKILVGLIGLLYSRELLVLGVTKMQAIWRLINIKRAAGTAAVWALTNPAMALTGLAVAALVAGAASSMISKAGDIVAPGKGKGKTKVSTKEGGLLELSPNDDLVAAPDLLDTLSSFARIKQQIDLQKTMVGGFQLAKSVPGGALAKTLPFLGPAVSVMSAGMRIAGGENAGNVIANEGGSLAGGMIGAAIGQGLIPIPIVGAMLGGMAGAAIGDLITESAKPAPIGGAGKLPISKAKSTMADTVRNQSAQNAALIAEIRAMRNELTSGKIGVSIDGYRVTSAIATANSRNPLTIN